MALTATQNATITKDAKGAFYTSLAARKPSLPVGPLISADVTDASSKDFGWFGMPSLPREWNGPRAHKAIRSYTDNLSTRKWENTVDINRELLEDDQTKQMTLANAAAALAERNQEHMVKRFTEVVEAGNAGTIGLAWDGQFVYDTDHSFGASGTVDNDLTATIATASDPTASELETFVGDAIEAMIAYPNDQGDPAGAPSGMNWVLMTPTGWLTSCAEAFGPNGNLGPGGRIEGDSASTSGVLRGLVSYFVNPYMANTDRSYLFRPGLPGAVGPFIFQRHANAPWEVNLSHDDENDIYVLRSRARYEIHPGDFLATCMTTVST